MKELEWMPLYWGKFIGGTSHMNASQIGGYMLLIHEQWYKGSVPSDRKKLIQIARLGSGKSAEENLSIILEKFVADKNGNLINNTCVSVFEEQQEKYAIRSERASKGGIAKKKKVLEAQSKQTASVLTPCSDGAELRVLSKDNTEKREMPSAEFEKIIDENEDDYLWIEEISKRFGFTDAYEANQQINFAYRKFIRDNYFQKGIPIYFNDHKHVRNSAVSWYEVIKKRQQSEAKRKQVW